MCSCIGRIRRVGTAVGCVVALAPARGTAGARVLDEVNVVWNDHLMTWVRHFGPGQFIAAEFAVLVGTICCFAKVQNDTWWHLAAGRSMAETGQVMLTEEFSHTAYGAHWANYEWLSEVVFYRVYQAGGLPLLVALCALSLMGACLLMWALMQGRIEDRLVVAGLALTLITPGWAVRPQAFSLLLLVLTVYLVTRDRLWLLPPVFLLWANLHGAVALGLVVLAGDLLAELVSGGRCLGRRVLYGLLSVGATLLTPLGLSYWPEVLRSLQRSQLNRIAEWQPPDLSVQYAVFWIGAIVFVSLAATHWRRLERTGDRTLVLVASLLLVFATRSTRNIVPFALVAAPAVSRLIRSPGDARRAAPLRTGVAGPVARASAFTLSLVLAVVVVHRQWAGSPPPADWTPVSREAAVAIGRCDSPIYNHYNDGGYLIWFVPERRVFLDSRQDPYPVELVQAQVQAERTGEYRELLSRYAIGCAVLRPDSTGLIALPRAGWRVTYRDAQWVVIESPRSGVSGPQGVLPHSPTADSGHRFRDATS
jgi:hypothetical protein